MGSETITLLVNDIFEIFPEAFQMIQVHTFIWQENPQSEKSYNSCVYETAYIQEDVSDFW